MKELYNVDDFVNRNSGTGYYSANQIVNRLFIDLSDKWENLGSANQQEVLNKAQEAANSNRCVAAAWRNPIDSELGHIAIVLSGSLQPVWGGMQTPNSENFAQGAPQYNFVCQKLSGAFALN